MLSKDQFLSALYEAEFNNPRGDHPNHVDGVYLTLCHFDQLFKADKASEVNELLTEVDESKLTEDILVGLLSATYPVRNLVPARQGLFDRAMVRLGEKSPCWLDELSGNDAT